MVSRINIGPDGGPYIAINENSGDIELEDNSGNVVAFWDETNTQWDFVSNDLTGVGALEADDITNGLRKLATLDGSRYLQVGPDEGGEPQFQVIADSFSGVGTSATTLFTASDIGTRTMTMWEVKVSGQDSNGEDFVDKVAFRTFVDVDVQWSFDPGTADTRTYSVDGSEFRFAMDNDSDTDITLKAEGTRE